MAFPKPPNVSRGQINRAGDVLRDPNASPDDRALALDLAEKWRACHAYPINTFQKTLRDKIKKISPKNDPIVAQRLKRMPTIMNKLQRFPQMQLARMQDIGGVRAVMEDMVDVNRLIKEYKQPGSNSRFEHMLVGEKDYISVPRSEDGYRSHHLIYSYKNWKGPDYEGLLTEIQFRTKLQHIWATAVETMGVYLDQPLKSRRGDQEWLDYFALVSSAFAHMENLPLVPRFSHLNKKETFNEIARAESDLEVLDKLTAFVVAADRITQDKKMGFYHLIVLNTSEKTVSIHSFSKDKFEEAKSSYSKIEARAAGGEKLEPVLVGVGSFSSLRRAYPNFFLDAREFVRIVRQKILKTS